MCVCVCVCVCVLGFFKWQIDFSKGVIFRIDCVAFLLCCIRPFDSVKKFLKSVQSSGLVQHIETATRKKAWHNFFITRPSDLLVIFTIPAGNVRATNESEARAMRILPFLCVVPGHVIALVLRNCLANLNGRVHHTKKSEFEFIDSPN